MIHLIVLVVFAAATVFAYRHDRHLTPEDRKPSQFVRKAWMSRVLIAFFIWQQFYIWVLL